jgi:mono/diheme cytochrome c family protein
MRRVSARVAITYALGVASYGGVWALIGDARQVASVSDGVYSVRQADRARPLYQARCAACHGDNDAGAVRLR